jgi:four helix bundle protein
VTPDDLRERTTAFAVSIIKICGELRRKPEGRRIADQLSDSATAIAANYRSATRARSRREFISKLAVSVEEADETLGWLEMVTRSQLASGQELTTALAESRELVAILSASRATAERNAARHLGRANPKSPDPR